MAARNSIKRMQQLSVQENNIDFTNVNINSNYINSTINAQKDEFATKWRKEVLDDMLRYADELSNAQNIDSAILDEEWSMLQEFSNTLSTTNTPTKDLAVYPNVDFDTLARINLAQNFKSEDNT